MAAASTSAAKKKKNDKQGWLEVRSAIDFFVSDFTKACFVYGGPFPKGERHVVFAFGTVVRFNIEKDMDKEWTYKPHDDKDYPIHRFTNEYAIKPQLDENAKEYDELLQAHPQHADAIRTAYRILITAGYPLPGGDGADTLTFPFGTRGDAKKTEENASTEDGPKSKKPRIGAPPRTFIATHAPVTADRKEEKKEEKYQYLWGVVFHHLGAKNNCHLFSLAMTETPDETEADAWGRDGRRHDYMIPRVVAVIDEERNVTYFE